MIAFLQGNALSIPLADKSVQCVVTSPPYWGLRDYGISNQLGLEKTPEEYVANMVQVFREVWRVLRDDGTLWLNLGDSYSGSLKGKGGNDPERSCKQVTNKGAYFGDQVENSNNFESGLKPKDLVGIPWRVAFALQADGWYLRSDIIWHKPNPMPESVTDRPTKAHEYVFLLTKSAKYYYDQDAVREEYAPASLPRALRGLSDENKWSEGAPGSTAHTMSQGRPNQRKEFKAEHGGGGNGFKGHSGYVDANGRLLVNPMGRNKRTVWTIPTVAFPGSHFATFPPALVEPCILAGTSERGACPRCGKPWGRLVERQNESNWEFRKEKGATGGSMIGGDKQQIGAGWSHDLPAQENITTGWQPACKCDAGDPIPCTVLDPFSGSGTVGLVARKYNRQFVGIELNADYIELARKRTREIQPMLSGVSL